MEYDFDIQWIKGTENIVADGLSRLLDIEREQISAITENRIPNRMFTKIQHVHNFREGHGGVETTIKKLKTTITDESEMSEVRGWVKQFIRQCPAGQKMSQIRLAIHGHPYTNVVLAPMEKINIDTIGPLTHEDTKESIYIIAIVDCFTRYVELYVAKDTSAEEAAVALVSFCSRYGTPSSILSDKGSQFVNELIEKLCNLLGVTHNSTIAYSKQQNGMIERANKEIMRHLRNIIFELKTQKWEIYIPLVQRIINTHVNERIGVAPYEIYGNFISLDRMLFDKLNERRTMDRNKPTNMGLFMDKLIQAQSQTLECARKHQRSIHDKEYSKRLEKYAEIDIFPVGSYVLVEYPHGQPNKLTSRWEGPMRVEKIDKLNSAYTLRDLTSTKLTTVHVSRFKPYYHDENNYEINDIASRDKKLWIVEKIIRHRGSPKHKTAMQFIVKWNGFPDEANTEEPWENVKDCEPLHQYLRDQNMENIIPNKYRKS